MPEHSRTIADALDRLTIDATCTYGAKPEDRRAIFDASRRTLREDSPNIADDPAMFRWRVTLRLGGREHSTDFFTGLGHSEPGAPGYGQRVTAYALDQWAKASRPTPPTAREVLYCLVSDALGWENARTFEDFATEYDYSTDSRRAERIYNACGETYKALLHFLPSGPALADWLEALDA